MGQILAKVVLIDPVIYTVVAGLHRVRKSGEQTTEIVATFQSKWKLERVAVATA